MNPFTLLIQIITVIYLTKMDKGLTDSVLSLLKESVSEVDLPIPTIGSTREADAGQELKDIIEWMLAMDTRYVFDATDLLQKVKISLIDFPDFYIELEKNINLVDVDLITKKVNSIITHLRYIRKQNALRKVIAKVNSSVNYNKQSIDTDLIRKLQEDLSEYSALDSVEHKGFLGRVSSSDLSALEDVFNKAKESYSVNGVLRTGYRGMNDITGINGFRRGELVNIGGLPGHYKSGFLLDFTRQIPIYNKPLMWDDCKKPAVVRLTFENKLDQDAPILYKGMMANETGTSIDVRSIDAVEASKYVFKQLGKNGYEVFIESFDPNNFDVYDLLAILEKYEADGYEIHLLTIDYLELITKMGSATRGDEAINNSFEMVRNHCFGRGITVVNAHQLSTAAQEIAKENDPDIAKRLSTGGWYRNCRSISTKLDLELVAYKHVDEHSGKSYITVARGKHRSIIQTPLMHQFYFQEFDPELGLLDDCDMDIPLRRQGSLRAYLGGIATAEMSDSVDGSGEVVGDAF